MGKDGWCSLSLGPILSAQGLEAMMASLLADHYSTPLDLREGPAGVPAVHAACVEAAMWAGRRGSGGRQVDGEVLEIETSTDEAAPFGGAQ
jgi:hypothetical protein